MGEAASPDEAPTLYERFTASYPSGVVLESFYPGGCTPEEARVGHLYAVIEPIEESRVGTPGEGSP